ncbi:MAG: PAS domain-containing protein [Silicimonas sp.]|nr:PAS domain-containing protein [Silicimonas sp.]
MNKVIDQQIDDFKVADVFLSRTDDRGIIRAGNVVFQRVSGFSWDELIGAPHKLVRHPDMPKAVFWRMWEELKAGNFFGGYVKNRAKCGRYYWVFAVAVPVRNGYLSVRFKPTTELTETVAELYRGVLRAEAEGLSPEEGFDRIEAAVKDMGFRDYRAFSAHAAGLEWDARTVALGQPENADIKTYRVAVACLLNLAKDVSEIRTLFEATRGAPTNLSILGSRLSDRRVPMQVVAQNYQTISDELLNVITTIGNGLADRLDSAFLGQLAGTSCVLYREAIDRFLAEEPDRGSADHRAEADILHHAFRDLSDMSNGASTWVEREAKLFAQEVSKLKRMLSGLAVTQVVCRIESASSKDDTGAIDEIANRLDVFQENLSDALDRMASHHTDLSNNVPPKVPDQSMEPVEAEPAPPASVA